MKTLPSRKTTNGATLVELIISIVLISIAVTGILGVMSKVSQHSADPMIQNQAVAIAEAYLEEVLLKQFCDPQENCIIGNAPGTANCTVCPAAEASRDLYDNICDYNGISNVGARNQSGTAIAGLNSYQIQVNVSSADALSGLSGANCELLRVDVAVSHSLVNSVNYTISGYRTNY